MMRGREMDGFRRVHRKPKAGGLFEEFADTKDIDFWVEATPENAAKVYRVLAGFGAPLKDHDVKPDDFVRENTIYAFGYPPRRIDVMTISHPFDAAWKRRKIVCICGQRINVVSLVDLIALKEKFGREKDKRDIKKLREWMK